MDNHKFKVKFHIYDGQSRTQAVTSQESVQDVLQNKLKLCDGVQIFTYWGEQLEIDYRCTFADLNAKEGSRFEIQVKEDWICSGCQNCNFDHRFNIKIYDKSVLDFKWPGYSVWVKSTDTVK